MSAKPGLQIVYDGECPFCARYVRLLRLRDAVGEVQLIDARGGHAVVDRLQAEGFDLNQGMALVMGEQVWFGDACMHQLACMSTPSGLFNRLSVAIFRRPALARVLYPVLRTGRAMTLRVMGRRPI